MQNRMNLTFHVSMEVLGPCYHNEDYEYGSRSCTKEMSSVQRIRWQRGSNDFITYEEKLIWSASAEGGEEEVNDYDGVEVVVVAFLEGSSFSLEVVTCRYKQDELTQLM